MGPLKALKGEVVFLNCHYLLPLHLAAPWCWPGRPGCFYPRQSPVYIFRMVHIDLFGPRGSQSEALTGCSTELNVCACQVMSAALINPDPPFCRPSCADGLMSSAFSSLFSHHLNVNILLNIEVVGLFFFFLLKALISEENVSRDTGSVARLSVYSPSCQTLY